MDVSVPELLLEHVEGDIVLLTMNRPQAKNTVSFTMWEEFSAALIQTFGKPIISTCACVEGLAAPLTFGGISSDILSKMDYVVKYRQDDKTQGECSPIARLDQYQELEFVRE